MLNINYLLIQSNYHNYDDIIGMYFMLLRTILKGNYQGKQNWIKFDFHYMMCIKINLCKFCMMDHMIHILMIKHRNMFLMGNLICIFFNNDGILLGNQYIDFLIIHYNLSNYYGKVNILLGYESGKILMGINLNIILNVKYLDVCIRYINYFMVQNILSKKNRKVSKIHLIRSILMGISLSNHFNVLFIQVGMISIH